MGWAADRILDEPLASAEILLHGSFLATGEGHGTQDALVAGLLGMAPDDEQLPKARELAQGRGIRIAFGEIDLGNQAHPNSTRLNLKGPTREMTLTAASVGGGSIQIVEIDGMAVDIRGTLESLLLWHHDTSGFLARVTAILACVELNVASIRTSRLHRGDKAFTSVEIDGSIPPEVPALLKCMPAVSRLALLPILPGF